MEIDDAGIDFIKLFEGSNPNIYQDSNGYDTIGVGHLIKAGEIFNPPLSDTEIDDLLRKDLTIAENTVNSEIAITLTQPQFNALVSLCFNIGSGNFEKSTLLCDINAGEISPIIIKGGFLMWVKTGGNVNSGLVRRRVAEGDLFFT